MKKVKLQNKKSLITGKLWIVASLLCVSFFSCEKDEAGELEGYLVTVSDVENTISGIASVKARLDGSTLATAKYSNGGFTIGLPDPDSKYLEELFDGVDGCMLDGFYAYDSDGDMLGEFLYAKMSANDVLTMGFFIYIDEDIEFHESDDDFTFNISGEKGWNLLYIITDDPDLETGTFTTVKQNGMMWLFSGESNTLSAKQHSAISHKLREKVMGDIVN